MIKKLFYVMAFGVLFIAMPKGVLAGEAAKTEEAAMTPEQKETMARMKEFTTVNEHHDVLKSLVGTWKTNVKFWMDPAGPAQESEGTSESQMIMGGRFLEQNFKGTMMGEPFEGRGVYGYDNMRKEYTGIWFDNMSTGMMVSSASFDAQSKVMTEEGNMSCPITNEKHRWYKAVTTIKDADNYTYESFMKDKDGKEFKGMAITYTRVK